MSRPLFTCPRRLIRVDFQSRQVWFLGHRVHHGLTGLLLIGCAVLDWRIGLLGLMLVLHDLGDRRDWLTDLMRYD